MEAYLDNSATTRPTENVISAMEQCMREGFYNPSSVYAPAVSAMRRVKECRELALSAIRGREANLVFTSGGTEANNLAILGAVGRMRGKQLVAVSAVEHPSVLEAYRALSDEGHEVRIIPVDMEGQPDWDFVQRAIDDGASLVSVMQVNNETGVMPDIQRLREMTRGKCLLHVDGVQGFLRVPFEMKQADLYTLSGHKIHGPKGIGALAIGPGVRLSPRQIGGGQEGALRSGTENTPGIAGLGAAIRDMLEMDEAMPAQLTEKKLRLIRLCREGVPNLLVNGPEPEKAAPHIVNLGFPGVRGEVMLHALEAEHVYVSTGSACSSKKLKVSPVLTAMGVKPATAEWALRFSLSPRTTNDEIEYAAEAVAKCYEALRRFQRR